MTFQSWFACCVAREDGDALDRMAGATSVKAVDLEFFDCYESEIELEAASRKTGPLPLPVAPRSAALPTVLARSGPRLGEATPVGGRADCLDVAALGADCCEELANELAVAAKVLERTRERWSSRVLDLRKDALQEFHNMAEDLPSWADLRQARRMLKANIGDAAKAVDVFLQALELRAKNSDMYDRLVCNNVCCDMRIIGRDSQEHPIVYMCARSQTGPLRQMINQFVVTFEAACKLAAASVDQSEGRVFFVFDMTGLRPHLYRDWTAMRELAKTLGTVFAERIFKIVIVDFPCGAGQAISWTVKQFLSDVTREKFAFVGEGKALDTCARDFDGVAYENLKSSLKINRDLTASLDDLQLHARRTAIHSVPLGPAPVQ